MHVINQACQYSSKIPNGASLIMLYTILLCLCRFHILVLVLINVVNLGNVVLSHLVYLCLRCLLVFSYQVFLSSCHFLLLVLQQTG